MVKMSLILAGGRVLSLRVNKNYHWKIYLLIWLASFLMREGFLGWSIESGLKCQQLDAKYNEFASKLNRTHIKHKNSLLYISL